MSGGARTLQKRILKRMGFHRDREFGDILDPQGKIVSKAPRTDEGGPIKGAKARWPRKLTPAK